MAVKKAASFFCGLAMPALVLAMSACGLRDIPESASDGGDNRSETQKVPDEIPAQNQSEEPDDGNNQDQDSPSAPDGKLAVADFYYMPMESDLIDDFYTQYAFDDEYLYFTDVGKALADEYIQMEGSHVNGVFGADGGYMLLCREQAKANSTVDMRPVYTFMQVAFADSREYPEKQKIGLATVYRDTWLEQMVKLYNRYSKKYYVEIVGTDASTLKMELVQGAGPVLVHSRFLCGGSGGTRRF